MKLLANHEVRHIRETGKALMRFGPEDMWGDCRYYAQNRIGLVTVGISQWNGNLLFKPDERNSKTVTYNHKPSKELI